MTSFPSSRTVQGYRVILTWADVGRAAISAIEIEIANRRKRLQQTQGQFENWQNRIIGLIAEMAVCRSLGLPWDAKIGNFTSEPDVGGYEVRATTRKDGRLILTPNDKDDRRYLLCVVDDLAPRVDLIGWIDGKTGKAKGSWETHREGGGAWYVARRDLRPWFPMNNDASDQTQEGVERARRSR